MGFANGSYSVIYKPRYVLWEMLVQLYKDSTNPIDKFACALAYEAKGALYRENALQKFEESIDYITPEFMQQFISYTPLCVYMKFSRLYESNHEYEKAGADGAICSHLLIRERGWCLCTLHTAIYSHL